MNEQYNNILIIGGGPAGLEAAAKLASLGLNPIIIEKESRLGGHLLHWDRLFPNGKKADEVLSTLNDRLSPYGNIRICTETTITGINRLKDSFSAVLSTGETVNAEAVLLTTGFDLFNARKKEEYGYGIYDRVITNADLEAVFRTGMMENLPAEGDIRAVGFVHCVGSRDEKAGNRHCSKVCCVTAVKQAMELKEKFPDAMVYCFYMDLRMFGRHFEDLYLEAQQKYGIRFIRGRVSEVSENKDCKLIVKAEDTLSGKPIKVTLDLLVLMAGMTNCKASGQILEQLSVSTEEDGFIRQNDPILASDHNFAPGIFMAGTCTGPKTLPETLHEAGAAALSIYNYVKNNGRD